MKQRKVKKIDKATFDAIIHDSVMIVSMSFNLGNEKSLSDDSLKLIRTLGKTAFKLLKQLDKENPELATKYLKDAFNKAFKTKSVEIGLL